MKKERNVEIIEDIDGTKIVKINDVIFKNRQHINWKEVEVYLKTFVGKKYDIEECSEKIYEMCQSTIFIGATHRMGMGE